MSKIKVFEHISEEYVAINGWKNRLEFPYTESSRDMISDYAVLELQLDSTNRNKFKIDHTYDILQKNIFKFIEVIQSPAYLFKKESFYQTINRIRSYKGVFSKEIAKDKFLQYEMIAQNQSSVIGSVLQLGRKDQTLIGELVNSSDSFILVSTRFGIFSRKTLEDTMETCMTKGAAPVFNYLKLMQELLIDTKDVLIRLSGDGGVTYLGAQFFCRKEVKDLLVLNLESVT